MKYFYQSGAMGFNGEGYWWHRLVGGSFPNFPFVTKTLTLSRKIGFPFAILFIPFLNKSVWNKVSLHNPGFYNWRYKIVCNNDIETTNRMIISITGTEEEIQDMCNSLYWTREFLEFKGIELNYSCPNIKDKNFKTLPGTEYPIYLKLKHNDDPLKYDLNNVKRIHLNSVPCKITGALSGKAAQKLNWKAIRRWSKEGLNVAGCSFNSLDDIKRLEDMGCTHIGIGSTMLTNPKLIQSLK